MNYWLGSLFQRNAHSPARRLYFGWLRRFTGVFAKRQAVRFVRIGGKRYKKVIFGDSLEAHLVEDALMALPPGRYFPPLIYRHENELLMGFVDGRRFDASIAADRHAVAQMLGALYARDQQRVSSASLQARLEIDAQFLAEVGLVDTGLAQALVDRAESVRPESIVRGLDYVDPVEKNFIVCDGRAFAIDVESLQCDTALGTGIAKAALHWLERDAMPDFVEKVEKAGDVALRDQLEFVELCFRVGWIKRKLLQGKRRFIRIGLLRELV